METRPAITDLGADICGYMLQFLSIKDTISFMRANSHYINVCRHSIRIKARNLEAGTATSALYGIKMLQKKICDNWQRHIKNNYDEFVEGN